MVEQCGGINSTFKYYEVQDLLKLSKTWIKNPTFSVFHTNICSLNSNVENMEHLLHDIGIMFDIITLSETWNPENKNSIFQLKHIHGYHDYYGMTGSTGKGGCGFFIKESLNYITRKDLDFRINYAKHECESCWVELPNKKKSNIIVGVIYRHPSKQDTIFIEKLKIILNRLRSENNKTILICGDFNLNLLNYDKDEYVSSFLNIMLENNFYPCIVEPSRVTNLSKPSLVDNIFINTSVTPISGNILEHISYDHLPNFIILEHEHIKKENRIKKRDLKNFDKSVFEKELLNLDLIQKLENANNTNDAFDIYNKKFIQLLNKHAPMKYLSNREMKLKSKPWLTKGILTSVKRKRKLFNKFKTQKTENIKSDETYAKYKFYRDTINTIKRKSKRMYYREFFSQNLNNSKKTWQGINELINKNKKQSKSIILNDNGLLTDPKHVANKFNHYFINVADSLSEKIVNKNNIFQDYLKNPNESSFFMKETTPDEISLIINALNVNKSGDIYDIAPKYVKLVSKSVSLLLTIIFNRSIDEGIFPTAMKTAKVIPIYKNDSTFFVSNYRPISLLPIFSKIFEKLVYNRFIEFIDKNNILIKNQYGFQKNKSTELAVASLVSEITSSFENKKSSYCTFLDFAKAFDTVNHNIMLDKLKYYGVRGKSLLWFESYLKNRSQYTEVGGFLSEQGYIKCGVPQGSILGPLLFLLYINDIAESSSVLNFFLFADDTVVYYSDKTNQETEKVLNQELDKVYDWLAANKLSLNVEKPTFMHFSLQKKKPELKILINNKLVCEKEVTKYLGVLIDNKLNWKKHIEYVKTKLSRSIGIISKIRYYIPKHILIKLYYSFIQSHLNYNLLNWSSTSTSNLECIRLSIKKIIRIISFINKYDHTASLFKELEILPLDSLIKFKQGIFMWKLYNGYIPLPVSSMFKLNTSEIVMRTNPGKFHLPNPRLNYAKMNISYSCVLLWNINIPISMKKISFLKSFSKKYKSFLLSH